MNLQILKESINAILPIKESDWLAVEPYLIEKSFEEGECFLKEKQVSEYIIFIYKGAIRSFYCNDELIETNLLLKSDGEFITEYESFVTCQPSRLSLQAIEKTEVVLVSRKIIDELYTTSFYWNQFGRIMSEYIFINSKKRTEELLFLSPE